MTTIVTVGTSIPAGTWLQPGESWPSRLAERAPGRVIIDRSLPGGAYTHPDDLGDTIRAHVDAAITLKPDQIILDGPVNDLISLEDITPLREAVFEAGMAVDQAGIGLLVFGILPFDDGQGALQSGWWPSLEPRRTTYNAWAQQMYGDRFVDLGWVVHQTTSYRADNRFFLDGLHPNRIGARMVAEVVPLERLV